MPDPMHIIGMQNVQYNNAIIFFGERKTDNRGGKAYIPSGKMPRFVSCVDTSYLFLTVLTGPLLYYFTNSLYKKET